MSVAVSNGYIYALPFGKSILKWTLNGTSVPFSTNVTFNSAYSLRVDTNGSIYVVDRQTSELTKLNADGTVSYQITLAGVNLPAAPQALAIDSNHYVYVSDFSNARILKIDASGSTVATFSASGLISAGALTVDGSGNLFVFAYYTPVSNNRVFKFNSTGSLLNIFDLPANTITPFGMISDVYGNYYLPNFAMNNSGNFNGGLYKYSSNGVQLSVYNLADPTSWMPVDVALDGSNNIYVANGSSIVVFEISNPLSSAPPISLTGSNDNNVSSDNTAGVLGLLIRVAIWGAILSLFGVIFVGSVYYFRSVFGFKRALKVNEIQFSDLKHNMLEWETRDNSTI